MRKLTQLEMMKLQDVADAADKVRSSCEDNSDNISDFCFDQLDLSKVDADDMLVINKIKEHLQIIDKNIEKISKDTEMLIDHFNAK